MDEVEKPACWLVKTEPHVFAIEDFRSLPNHISPWDGVRNYQARNNLRAMRLSDQVLLYHSNIQNRGIVGTARVVRESYPDPSALDPTSPYFDPRSKPQNPRWFQVDLQLEHIFAQPLTLETIKQLPELADMLVASKGGQRLSVQPVNSRHMQYILALAGVEKSPQVHK